MHAVEIADRHHRASKRPAVDALRAAARDMEVLSLARRTCSSGYPGDCRDRGQRRAHLHAMEHCGASGTVTAPLTNFQINGLFKRHCYFSPPFGERPVRAMHHGCRSVQAGSDRGRLQHDDPHHAQSAQAARFRAGRRRQRRLDRARQNAQSANTAWSSPTGIWSR